jgi:hypothetical protein
MESHDVLTDMETAVSYYKSNAMLRDWFTRNNINAIAYLHIIFNMSKHPALTKWFCHTRFNSDAKTFASRDKAIATIKQYNNTDKLLLIHFVELDTYGIYTPQQLEDFVNVMIVNINAVNCDRDETKIILKCNINQFVFDNQKQKMIFRYEDENTLDKLKEDIKTKTDYDIQITKITNGNYEITVQQLNNNKEESDKLFKELKNKIDTDLVGNVKKKKTVADMPDCLSATLLSIDNQNAPYLIDEHLVKNIIELSKTSPIQIIINNNIVNCQVNNGNIGNNGVVNIKPTLESKRQDTLNWINANPPYHKEITGAYYNRYKETSQLNPLMHHVEFGKVMKNKTTYESAHNGVSRYWKNPNNIKAE